MSRTVDKVNGNCRNVDKIIGTYRLFGPTSHGPPRLYQTISSIFAFKSKDSGTGRCEKKLRKAESRRFLPNPVGLQMYYKLAKI
jgi:hypothetical protein